MILRSADPGTDCIRVREPRACITPTQADLEHAHRLLGEAILFDRHNDLPWAIRTDKKAPGDIVAYDLRKPTTGQTDIPRLRQGGLSAQFWSVYVPGELTCGWARTQLEQIDLMRRVIARYPERLSSLRARLKTFARPRKPAASDRMLGIEGGHAIEDSLGALRAYYDLGVRYMTLTHNTNTDWADSAADVPAHHGLTAVRRAGGARDESHRHAGGSLAHLRRDHGGRAARVARARHLLALVRTRGL